MSIKKVTNEELRKMMMNGPVTFQYKKNDGTIRQAVGTLQSSLITKKPVGGQNKVKDAGYSTYFDIEKDWWRSYAESRLIGVVES